jgi:hypothetical protein
MRLAHSTSLVVLTDLSEIYPFSQIILSVFTSARQRQQPALVDCAATLDFVSKGFVTQMELKVRKSSTTTYVRLANGHRAASTRVCDITVLSIST